ncbi:helix-hairpin-helix domain-containing protein [Cellulomonas xiejunii]|uniref:helix-hairpin-helix domain-containing protein n=1 Tax=Cellulomonas xiejunii TaxID=2968083 RepID=UPI001D0E3195|nr:helix-hairpin-helix domain-containing protein [Cellulomonas xiejunii]MCC2313397.1 helix-hairpin-helix domain-containing protein [Cellulomonas xiejunii]
MPLDRSRVPPDVARRLAVLAAHLEDVRDARPGVESSTPVSAAVTGWVPRPPAPGDRSAEAPRVARARGPVAPAHDEPTGDAPVPHPPVHPPLAGPEADPWHPSVTSALAVAAASRPPMPAAVVRWAPGWRTAGAAVLVLALVMGGIVLRASAAPRGEPVAVPTPAVADPDAGAREPVDAPDQVVVHVVGAVAQPAVVRLALGARVAEAIAAAGGSTPEADLATVNLARVLTDGEQLVVPVVGAPVVAAVPDASDGLVDLNAASAAELEELPGVGPVLAGRIVEHRTALPFTTVDELDDVAGIGPALLADLRTRVRV